MLPYSENLMYTFITEKTGCDGYDESTDRR